KAAYGRVPRRPGVCYFFPRPSVGSGCKRLNLFLRWMVRRDALDLGVWTRVSPAKLVVPLDTHVIRVGRCLRLTRYTSPGWAMAQDITASLRHLDADDPVKYDFALCHLGMMNACGFMRARLIGPGDRGPRILNVRCVACAGHAGVHGGGFGDHPLDGESLGDACEAGLAHPAAHPFVIQQPDDRLRHRLVVAWRDEE